MFITYPTSLIIKICVKKIFCKKKIKNKSTKIQLLLGMRSKQNIGHIKIVILYYNMVFN